MNAVNNDSREVGLMDLIGANRLLHAIFKPKHFVVSPSRNFVSLECPSCNNSFGLDANFNASIREINFHYTCPYCRKEFGVEE